jgi:hypothetical protein
VDDYFDTNAISYLDTRHGWNPAILADAREKVRQLVRSGSVSVFVSLVLLEELLGILRDDPDKHRRVIEYLWEIARNNLFLATNDLGREEARRGGRLIGNDRLELWVNVVAVYRECRNEPAMVGIPQQTQEWFARFEEEEKERVKDEKRRSRAKTGARSPNPWRRWCKAAEERVDDWVSSFMEANQGRLGLSQDRREWPQPRELESIWRFHAYKMARIYLNVGEGRRVRGSDLYDAHHYVAASYADVTVSDDRDLRATCGVIPRQAFRLESFEEFLVKTLGIKRRAGTAY